MNAPDPHDSLSRTLAEWRVRPPRSPEFRSNVWTRIAALRGGVSWGGFVRAHAPMVAAACAFAVVAGGWVGREQARSEVNEDRAYIVEAYVRALDARTMTH